MGQCKGVGGIYLITLFLLVNAPEVEATSGAELIEDNISSEDIIELDQAIERDEKNSDVQQVTEDIPTDTDEVIIYSNFDLRNPDVYNSNKSVTELAREKVYLKKKCEFNIGEITVCADPNEHKKYRIVNKKPLRELPRNQRSWVVLSESLRDNGLASTSANSHSAFAQKSLQAARAACEDGLEKARKQNEQARAIAKIAVKQTGSKPKHIKGPCEF